MRNTTLIFLLIACLTACQTPPAATPTPIPPVATAAATTVPEPTIRPTAVPEPTPTEQAAADLSLYTQGLTTPHKQAVDTLADAPVYHLDIELDAALSTLVGKQELFYANQETVPLNEIYFRLFPNHFLNDPIAISDLVVDEEPVTPELQLVNTILYVPLPSPLLPGEQTAVQFTFSLDIPPIETSPLSLFGYGDGILALDQFYPALVVFDDDGWSLADPPQWEESGYADASFFQVSVTLPADQIVIASGVEIAHEAKNGSQTVTFAAGPARGFSLVAGTDLEATSQTVGETTITSYAPPSSASGALDALTFAVNALNSFNERLGPYPYTEFDIVSTPLAASGSASAGFVVINQTYYEGDDVFANTPAFNDLERTVAHEFAHQWFYNLVNNDYASELWFAEGFAQYMTGLYYLDIYGEEEQTLYVQDWTVRWSQLGSQAIPIGLPVQAYGDGEVRAIIYGRAPIFITTLAEEMGTATFATFLEDFLSSFQWEQTTGEQFKAIAEENCACDLTPLFEQWVYDNPQLAQDTESDGPRIVLDPGIPFAAAQEATDFDLVFPAYFPETFEFYGVSLMSNEEAALNFLQSEPSARLAALVQTAVGAESQFTISINAQDTQTVLVNGVEAVWKYDAVSDDALLEWTSNGIHYRLAGIVNLEEALQIAESLG